MWEALKEIMGVARRRPWAAAGLLALALVCQLAVFFIGDYLEFTKSRREELAQFYQDLRTDRRDLDPVILAFVAKAKSGDDVPPEKRDELTLKLLQVAARAQQVATALPDARTEANNLVDAMTVFRAEALKLKGPADARPFWEALGRLDDAERALATKVASVQGTYTKRATS